MSHTSPQTGFTRALLSAVPPPAGVQVRRGANADARFAIYRNNVHASLIAALADAYPVCQALVGAPFFAAMALAFMAANPPRSPILAHYGDGLDAFIRRYPPAAPLPYLADMATLEWARVRCFHAADVTPLTPEDLNQALTSNVDLGSCYVQFSPAVAIVRSPFAIISLWQRHQRSERHQRPEADLPPVAMTSAESALVVRHSQQVWVQALNDDAARLIDALRQGATLNAALARVDSDVDLAPVLALLLQADAMVALEPVSARHPSHTGVQP